MSKPRNASTDKSLSFKAVFDSEALTDAGAISVLLGTAGAETKDTGAALLSFFIGRSGWFQFTKNRYSYFICLVVVGISGWLFGQHVHAKKLRKKTKAEAYFAQKNNSSRSPRQDNPSIIMYETRLGRAKSNDSVGAFL